MSRFSFFYHLFSNSSYRFSSSFDSEVATRDLDRSWNFLRAGSCPTLMSFIAQKPSDYITIERYLHNRKANLSRMPWLMSSIWRSLQVCKISSCIGCFSQSVSPRPLSKNASSFSMHPIVGLKYNHDFQRDRLVDCCSLCHGTWPSSDGVVSKYHTCTICGTTCVKKVVRSNVHENFPYGKRLRVDQPHCDLTIFMILK